MNENKVSKKQIILIIIGIIIALLLIIFKLFFSDNKKDFEIVTSTSKFYTVSNCINRYLTYLSAGDTENLMLLLNKSYKNKNNITSNNLFDKIDKFDELYSFQARKMYQDVINDNVTKYYVYGYLIKEGIDDSFVQEKVDYYFIVYLDSKNSTYSIEPYDGIIFLEAE